MIQIIYLLYIILIVVWRKYFGILSLDNWLFVLPNLSQKIHTLYNIKYVLWCYLSIFIHIFYCLIITINTEAEAEASKRNGHSNLFVFIMCVSSPNCTYTISNVCGWLDYHKVQTIMWYVNRMWQDEAHIILLVSVSLFISPKQWIVMRIFHSAQDIYTLFIFCQGWPQHPFQNVL